MSKKMNPVVHFEMPYENKDRMAEFYSKTFGWKTQNLGQEMGNYVLASTCEVDDKTHFPKQPGMINGGFFEKTKDNNNASVVIAVEDVRQAMKDVEAAGGKVLGGMNPGEPDDIPGVGKYCMIIDTEGNKVGMLQPNAM